MVKDHQRSCRFQKAESITQDPNLKRDSRAIPVIQEHLTVRSDAFKLGALNPITVENSQHTSGPKHQRSNPCKVL